MTNKRRSSARARNSSQLSSSMRSTMERKESLQACLEKAQELRDNDPSVVTALEEVITEMDSINLEASIDDMAACQDEVLIDSQLMSVSSKVIKSATTSLTKVLSPYNCQDFAEKLLSYVCMLPDTTVNEPNWSILEIEVSKIIKRTPNFSILSGCLDIPEKKVVVKHQPVKRDVLKPTSRPQTIVNIQKDNDSVEETIQKIKRLISSRYKETGSPVEYLRLILHPHNFGKTVENMLHVSFLIRDGIIKMMLDNENPVIMPCTKEMKAEARNGQKRANVQNIISLNPQTWRALVKALHIEHPMINYN